MRWPWKRHANGEAKQAIADADEQYDKARNLTPPVDKTARAANELSRRTDRFARDIERSMHLRRGAT